MCRNQMEIPPEIVVPTCIEQGTVFHYTLEATNHDGAIYRGNRFFVVLNAKPQTDPNILLVTLTTKIENQRRFIQQIGESPETLVEITSSDFSPLSSISAVNCNKIYEISMDELIDKVRNGGKIFFEKLSKTAVSAILSGVIKSSQVESEKKKFLI